MGGRDEVRHRIGAARDERGIGEVPPLESCKGVTGRIRSVLRCARDVLQTDDVGVGRRREMPRIREPGAVRRRDSTLIAGGLDIDGLRYKRRGQGIDHADVHLEAADQVIARKKTRTAADGRGVRLRILGRAKEELSAGIHRQRHRNTRLVRHPYPGVGRAHVDDMAFWAQPHVVERRACPDSHGDECSVVLIARGDPDVLANQRRGLGGEVLDRRFRLGVEVVEKRAVRRVRQYLERLGRHHGGLRVGDGEHREILGDRDRAVVRSHGRHRTVGVSQHEPRDSAHGPPANGTVEVDRPNGGTRRRRGRMADDEGRMLEIEFKIQCVALPGGDDQRRIENHFDRHGAVGCGALPALNLDLAGGNARTGGAGKAGLGVRRDGQNHVSRIATDGDGCTGVSAGRNAGVAENFGELVQLFEIDHWRLRRCGVDRDGAAAVLRRERDVQDFDADCRPVFRGVVADSDRKIGHLGSHARRASAAGAGHGARASATGAQAHTQGAASGQQDRFGLHVRYLG